MRRWRSILNDEMTNAGFYRDSPLKSRVLVYVLVVLSGEVVCSALVVAAEWGRMPATMVIWVAAVVAWSVHIWLRALKGHRELRTMFERGEVGDVVPGSPLDKALRVAADTMVSCLFSMFGVSAGFVFSLAEALRRR